MAGQRRVIGGVLKVPLGDRWHGYAWTLAEVDFALFDLWTDADVPVPEVVAHPVAFRVGVNSSAYLDGRWPRVGKVAPPPELLAPVPKFIQDPITGRFSIYLAGDIRPATRAECVGLERCAVWAPEHVEDRLRDHFAGRPCKWVESLAMAPDAEPVV
ncbi:MAG: hypothetical protein U0796_02880 [Gemmatales bacterium]